MAPGAWRRGAQPGARIVRGDRRLQRSKAGVEHLSIAKGVVQNLPPSLPEVEALEAEAMRAMQSGREAEAVRHWERILELRPSHVRALSALGQRAFQRGEMQAARAAFQRIADADG